MAWKDLHRVGIVATLVRVFFIGSVSGQNLVPNPSFEEYDFCSSSGQGLARAAHWTVPPQGFTPDYYNRCSQIPGASVPDNFRGSQEPNSGDAYMGLVAMEPYEADFREAISCQLLSPLQSEVVYVVNIHLSLSELSSYQISTVGFLLSNTPLNEEIPMVDLAATFSNSQPLDSKSDWMSIVDTLTAQGGEWYLTISNFVTDLMSDSVYLGGGFEGDRAYYYIDDVSIIPLDSLLSVDDHASGPDRALSLYPNPNQGTFTVQLPLAATQKATMEVYSISGQLVHTERLYPGSNRLQLNVADGLYLYRVMVNREPKWLGKISIGSE